MRLNAITSVNLLISVDALLTRRQLLIVHQGYWIYKYAANVQLNFICIALLTRLSQSSLTEIWMYLEARGKTPQNVKKKP